MGDSLLQVRLREDRAILQSAVEAKLKIIFHKLTVRTLVSPRESQLNSIISLKVFHQVGN